MLDVGPLLYTTFLGAWLGGVMVGGDLISAAEVRVCRQNYQIETGKAFVAGDAEIERYVQVCIANGAKKLKQGQHE